MESFFTGIAEHGYTVLFLAVFLEAIGLPVPAALALLIAGGAAAAGSLSFFTAWAGSILVMASVDVMMFFAGRATGWWLLGILCRISLNPESCILRSADSFFKRGRTVLVFAKFVPGLNTMAPPLAGSMNMRFLQFFGLDLLGATLYMSSYLSIGFLFSGALEAITSNYNAISGYVGQLIVIAIIGYLLYQTWVWTRARAFRMGIPAVDPAGVAVDANTLIFDVRSHGYYDARAERIRGSRRLDPHTLNQVSDVIPEGRRVYLYCTCIREATSARVAHELRLKGIKTTVIRGGLRAWKKAGLPVETVPAEEVSLLPMFEQRF